MHLNVVLLFRGPVLGLFAMAGCAARHREDLRSEGQRETGLRSMRVGWGAEGVCVTVWG